MRKDKCELWSIIDLPSVDREVTRNMGNGFEVLGAAVGSTEFVSSCLQKRVQKVVSILENLSYLDDPQCALGILRYCLGTPKLVYSLRTNTPNKRASDSRVFKELYENLEPFNLNSYTQKIQEAVDTEKFSELLRNQSSNREKARLQSLCLPHSGAWLAAPPVPALGLHLSPSEFQISVKTRYCSL